MPHLKLLQTPIVSDTNKEAAPISSVVCEWVGNMNDNKAVSEHAPRGDETKLIADALRQKFGGDAKTVARIQYEEATDDQCRDVWDRVLSRLSY